MIEFFENIFNWFVTNKDEIIMFISSTNFVTLVSTVILLVKQIKTTNVNTSTVTEYATNLFTSKQLTDSVSEIATNSDAMTKLAEDTKLSLDNIEANLNAKFDIYNKKLEAILDVQSIAYSSLKDDTARTNIANIISSAKFADDSVRLEMEKELEELRLFKASIVDKVDSSKNAVIVQSADEQTTVKKQTVSRY